MAEGKGPCRGVPEVDWQVAGQNTQSRQMRPERRWGPITGYAETVLVDQVFKQHRRLGWDGGIDFGNSPVANVNRDLVDAAPLDDDILPYQLKFGNPAGVCRSRNGRIGQQHSVGGLVVASQSGRADGTFYCRVAELHPELNGA